MDTRLTALSRCRLFQDLPRETLEREILPRGKRREFERQRVLIAPGDRVDWFGVVLRGKVQISQIFSDGTSSLMDALGPGYPLGTDLICTRSRRSPYYAIAAGPLQILPEIARPHFQILRLLIPHGQNPAAAYTLFHADHPPGLRKISPCELSRVRTELQHRILRSYGQPSGQIAPQMGQMVEDLPGILPSPAAVISGFHQPSELLILRPCRLQPVQARLIHPDLNLPISLHLFHFL